MEQFVNIADIFISLDKYLALVIQQYGVFTYLILFLIIFSETGLVVAPFFPGDSLLFAAGTFAAIGSFDIIKLAGLLIFAAILGNSTNYWIGYFVGRRILKSNLRIINPRHLERTHEFYEKYGGKTIIIARFVPIVRTFAPFVAGLGKMTYARFIKYDLFGGSAWVSSFVFLGYFFGNVPFVKENFTLVIFAIILISVMPAILELIRHKLKPLKS